LKRALDERVRLIGTASSDLVKPFQEPAVQRRLFMIPLSEPSPLETVEILMGLKPTLERHHGIEISDAAIQFCVTQSASLPGKFPAKAIDLLDLACAQLALQGGHTVALDDVLGAANTYETRFVCQEKKDDNAGLFSE